MSKIKDGGPAFAFAVPERFVAAHEGMYLRDWFAGQALPLVARMEYTRGHHIIARDAYAMADAMIKAREATDE